MMSVELSYRGHYSPWLTDQYRSVCTLSCLSSAITPDVLRNEKTKHYLVTHDSAQAMNCALFATTRS